MTADDKVEVLKLKDFYSQKYLQALISRTHAVMKFSRLEVDHSEVKVQDVHLRQAKDLFISASYLQRYLDRPESMAAYVAHVAIIPETFEILRLRNKTPDLVLKTEQALTIMLWRDLAISENEVGFHVDIGLGETNPSPPVDLPEEFKPGLSA